jgi:hypothetical protein
MGNVKPAAVDKLCASFPNRFHVCLEDGRQSISWDKFRVNEIQFHVHVLEPQTTSKDKRSLRPLKELGAKSGEISLIVRIASRMPSRIGHLEFCGI